VNFHSTADRRQLDGIKSLTDAENSRYQKRLAAYQAKE